MKGQISYEEMVEFLNHLIQIGEDGLANIMTKTNVVDQRADFAWALTQMREEAQKDLDFMVGLSF